MGVAQTQSPTIKNCAPESPMFQEIAGFNQAGCNALASTRTTLLIMVSPVPGKLKVISVIYLNLSDVIVGLNIS